ncbi:MAG: hypothetical protein JO336_01170, partial [Acidobacteriia bacterium]|nr:hypothetical protein [Terriglobia bacterium]
ISGDDKITRTIPISQVQSIQYDGTAATASQTQPAVPAPVSSEPAPAAPSPANAPAPAPQAAPPPPVEQAPPHPDHYHPPEAAVTSTRHEIPAGTQVAVRTEETIDSSKAVEGQTFAAEVVRDVHDQNGGMVIPRGSNATIVIESVSQGSRFHGRSDLVLDLSSISVGGRLYRVSTSPIEEKGKDGVGANKRTAEFSGGGGAFGAIVGAIAGGGKGAAIGALSGAGAGAVANILTKGTIKVPVETVLTFRLDRPLWIRAAN